MFVCQKGWYVFCLKQSLRVSYNCYIPDQTRAVIAVCSFLAGQSLIEEIVLLLFLVLQQILILPHCYQQVVQGQNFRSLIFNLVTSVVCRAAKILLLSLEPTLIV